ncbi:MAG TPA: hypothetical protein VFF03_08650 [Rhodocyclaceae bacterium]|nr:hypothetical protein [Rhodocyclaceae bacterium]
MASTSYPAESDATSAPAFWTRIPDFFRFPLRHPQILGRIGMCAAIPAVGTFASGMQSMFLAIAGLSIVAWIILLRHGSRVLCETAQGHLSPADYSWEPDGSLVDMPYKLFGLFVVTSIVVGVAASLFGQGASMVANLAIMLFLPAATMVLVQTRSLTAGLNPSLGWEIAKAMGKPYLLLCLFLFCLSSSQMLVSFWVFAKGFGPLLAKWAEAEVAVSQTGPDEDIEPILEPFFSMLSRQRPRLFLSTFAATATAMYFTIIAFNMMGYVLYQYHRRLGLEIDNPDATDGSAPNREADPVADLITAGKIDEALNIAYEAQRLEPENVDFQLRYHRLLHLAGKDDRLLSHAQRLLALLLTKGMPGKALDALRLCRERKPEFRPEDPATVLALAKAARTARDGKLALDILRSFDRLFKNHPLIPEVYALSALILCEDFRQDKMAEQIFTALCQRFPDHPCANQAREYLKTLARLQGAAG